MAKMKQPGTDLSLKNPTGEREPKGADASDRSGEKSGRTVGGVPFGRADQHGTMEQGVGRQNIGQHEGGVGEFNSGSSASVCYEHKRLPHDQR